ncbi:hypothetical protein [Salinimicrobium flavum]|uniref:Uncharacterized protein n=1 Tax=Salinimicrobium flavum TaxID=1737065 RepID=A0ABW5IZ41_9FLAO
MRVELKNERFYITLPQRLYVELLEWNKEHERMDLDLTALILHFILKQQSEPQEWVPLSSVILRKYDNGRYKSSEQIELLQEGEFIEFLNHQNNIPGKENSCRRFRISSKYFEQEKDASNPTIHSYEIKQQPLLKKLEKHNRHRKIEASSTTAHLTKWLESDGFTIDKEAAFSYIEEKYHSDSRKYLTRYDKVVQFDPAQSYSRDGDDDRLHSIFTQLPKDLKPFVSYQGQQLIEMDVKNSQPMMFVILLEEFLQHIDDLSKSKNGVKEGRLRKRIYNTLKKYINNNDTDYYNNNKYTIDIETISYSITIILLETFGSPDIAEIDNFISLVNSGAIYEKTGELLLSTGAIWQEEDTFFTILYNKEKNKQEISDFGSLRKCGKTLIINALYSPRGKGSVRAINKVKELYPSIFRIVEAFKDPNYKDFALILQRMEAKCILDHCAKNIARKYPDMPLICRHDSLSTSKAFGDDLFEEFKNQIESYFGTEIKVEKEVW